MDRRIRWTVLTLGYFTRNRYWGEDENGEPHRPALCTSTLLEGGGRRVVIDPPAAGAEMAAILDRRTGLRPEQIDAVYVTHCHYDHYQGLGAFPRAELLCAPDECDSLRLALERDAGAFPGCAERLHPAPAELLPGAELRRLPGHTSGLAGVWFEAAEGRVLVAADAVMTADHFRDRRGYLCADDALAATTIARIAEMADIVVPGHSNYFLVTGRRDGAC